MATLGTTPGAGAALAGPVTTFPQLIWLSEHKPAVFGVAAILLVASGAAIWYARSLPCPVPPDAARACQRLRRVSVALYVFAVANFGVGILFAFLLPRLSS